MKIYDLTRGHYPNLYSSTAINTYVESIEEAYYDCTRFSHLFDKPAKDMGTTLGDIPIFLVESSMSGEYVSVPGADCLIRVPKDKYLKKAHEPEQDEAETPQEKRDDPRERTSQPATIADLLGVYTYLGEGALLPRRIFIWMDKIVACTKELSDHRTAHEIGSNARALYDFVVCHELAHAMMDIELHGMCPDPNFSYGKNFVYRFIEEAYANAIGLSIVYDKLSSSQQSFIHKFVQSQPDGYAHG